uniref:Utp12 domain-containing protein n=1 Tax=Rhabditophanes sp. KR3021 TaxID=114890 RepID=A0AC35UEX3_9BILA
MGEFNGPARKGRGADRGSSRGGSKSAGRGSAEKVNKKQYEGKKLLNGTCNGFKSKDNTVIDFTSHNEEFSSEDSVSSPIQVDATTSGGSKKVLPVQASISQATNLLASESVNAISCAVSLTQSLLSGDSAKIDAILYSKMPQKEIKDTVKDLPTTNVIRLLKYIEDKLRSTSGLQVEYLVRWSGLIISHHMSYLMTITSLDQELGSFLEWIRSRVSQMETIFILNGKLRLICEQIEKRSNVASFATQAPANIFQYDESDDDFEEALNLANEIKEAEVDDGWWDEDEEIAEKMVSSEVSKKAKSNKRKAEAVESTSDGEGNVSVDSDMEE